MTAQATGTRLDASFGELAEHWLDAARHPDWSPDYAKKVRSVTSNWLIAERVTVQTTRAVRIPLSAVALSELDAAIAAEALSHVLSARAHGTYRTAHECLTAILTWGQTIRWLPAGHIDTVDIKRAPDPRAGARRKGARGNISPVPKDDIPDLDGLLLPFHRWVEERQDRSSRNLLDLLAF